MATLFLWADFFSATAFGGFDGQQWPLAFRARLVNRWIPYRVIAIGIGFATVEQFAIAALALD